FFFDYYFGVILTGSLLILGFIGGVIGGFVRKKLLTGKYANYPEPRKLPLGKGRSAIGILGFLLVLSTLLILLMGY
ncbi:hypothetical protein, partial [Persicitalea sp.]|uniref:hypothetical protein n=1 Tax=Persicitalea sp. TaxID=3100273 RepID=UPI0035945A09